MELSKAEQETIINALLLATVVAQDTAEKQLSADHAAFWNNKANEATALRDKLRTLWGQSDATV